ncbi:MAG: DUF2461 domain-containing protein [Coprobacter sp.]|nr:DUF2461 domain-containing protein [Coprobacter sp.]
MKEILQYLQELQANNNRIWFNERKERYQHLRLRFQNKMDELIGRISAFDEELAGMKAGDCMYRIYRDTRFSPDKTPYKNHFSAYLCKGGRKSVRAGYYFHLEPGHSLLSGGVWCPEPKLLKALRQSVYDYTDEFKEIIQNKTFKTVYPRMEGEMLKIVPRPFPKDFPDGELLKRKDYVVITYKDDSFFDDPDWMERVVADFKTVQPFNRFLNETVDDVYDL